MPERLKSSEIPLPNNRLFLIDLDKTLTDATYEITDSHITAEIARVQSLGWTLGLSSDTAPLPLLRWQRKLGLNGPILAEKGAIAVLPDGREIIAAPESAEDFFSQLRLSLIAQLTTMRLNFIHGDVTQFIRNRPILKEMVDPRLVLVQAYRRFSLNFYGKRISSNGQLEIDNKLTTQIKDILSNLVGKNPPFELEEDFNPEYGICILAAKTVNKRQGTLMLLRELGYKQIGIIGDSMADFVGEDIAYHYAVGNAKEKYKEKADYVASSQYTTGVVEILGHIK